MLSCKKNEDNDYNEYVCPNDDCWTSLYTDFKPDQNGYHHVSPTWFSETSGRFNIHIESISTLPDCQYNAIPSITTKFDSNTFWEVESGLSFIFGLYNPFQSLYTQNSSIIKVKDTIVNISYFQGTIIPIVQETSVSLDVKDKISCWGWTNPKSGPTPTFTDNCVMYSKRIVGPLISEMIGDTIKIYSETYFDCGSKFRSVKDSISVIIN